MAKRDIAGLLTGIPSGGIDPRVGMTGRQMLVQSALAGQERMAGGLRGMFGMSPVRSEQENIQGAILKSKLDELEKQKRGKETTLQSLRDLGLNEEADIYAKGGMTDAQASGLALNERNIKRVAEGTKNQQLAYLINQGVGKDDPLYQDIDAGLKLSDSQLSSAIKQRNKMLVPEYSSKNLKLMNVEGSGQQMVGTYTIDNGRQKQEVLGYMGVTPDGNLGLIPVDPNVLSPTTSKGIDISGADINRAHLRLSTAGSRFKGKEKKWLLGAFSTDWDEAWDDLSADDKNTISTLVAQETKRNQQELNMDFAQAEEKAIKDVFVDKLRKSKFFELGETEVMTTDEIEAQRKKDLKERLKRY